ncbi:hypothetical protein IT882_02305 [Microbacterium schleiferi]|uniref:Uncharacterized protein n=1 Tax=Microbacterium schleiferi TaxID=69362 RepID=A0A7S8MYN4_9MICO|nr:hypothetical protein [Microbacterium schleiferi]QPE04975.1 hypothetical protein IT882_02305 [Microbacterium schleiferi]
MKVWWATIVFALTGMNPPTVVCDVRYQSIEVEAKTRPLRSVNVSANRSSLLNEMRKSLMRNSIERSVDFTETMRCLPFSRSPVLSRAARCAMLATVSMGSAVSASNPFHAYL